MSSSATWTASRPTTSSIHGLCPCARRATSCSTKAAAGTGATKKTVSRRCSPATSPSSTSMAMSQEKGEKITRRPRRPRRLQLRHQVRLLQSLLQLRGKSCSRLGYNYSSSAHGTSSFVKLSVPTIRDSAGQRRRATRCRPRRCTSTLPYHRQHHQQPSYSWARSMELRGRASLDAHRRAVHLY